MRTLDFAYRVLRGNAILGWMQAPVDSGRTLRMDSTAEIKTSLSGSFGATVTDADGKEVEPDWLSDEIQPVMILDGVEYSLGVFAAANITPFETNGLQSLQIEAYDRCWRVRDTHTETPIYFAAGTNYIAAVESVLISCGISLILATPTTATLAEDRQSWEIGTSCLSIVNELLGEINYHELWFTADGSAVLEPVSVPTAANIEHRLSDEEEPGADPIDRMLPSISRQTDVYAAPNAWLVICQNPDKSATMTATAENTNPQSPLSISRRGRRIVQVVTVDNIADQDALQAYADRLRNDSMIGGETIRVSTALLPGWGVRDVVALRYGDLSALCIETGYSMDLRLGGSMTHELERVVYHFG